MRRKAKIKIERKSINFKKKNVPKVRITNEISVLELYVSNNRGSTGYLILFLFLASFK